MAERIDVSKLSRHQKFYVAGFRRGLKQAMIEARTVYREEMAATFRELEELRAAYAELAVRHHRAMLDRAVDEAINEREREPFRPLH
jgi:hypothetical protein